MILHDEKVIIKDGKPVLLTDDAIFDEGREKTLAYQIINKHHSEKNDGLFHLTFDSLASHDITYVGIIQTARASGMERFPMPYVLTNCHNSLCAVGGTINEDDHRFALSAAHKYGGIYVPTNYAVIHSYNREMMSGGNRMILASDSHTRYGALGTMGVGEGGGELAKQLVGRSYDIAKPEVVLVYLTGKPHPGVGPHDVALDIVTSVYQNGFVKNKVMEFVGPGIKNLSQDYRNAIDVMTTETTCWSSIWETDDTTKKYYDIHGRSEAYVKLTVEDGACYNSWIELDLSKVECMISLPSHPSKGMPINKFKENAKEILTTIQEEINDSFKGKAEIDLLSKLDSDGNFIVDQAIISGCSGGVYENIAIASKILKGHSIGNGNFRLSVYPDSMCSYNALVKTGVVSDLIESGAIFREAFCGPCFGAGDTPANNEFSIRHNTRNFPNREGAKPNEGQLAAVALMDARSIAATALNKGVLTAASDIVSEDIIVEEEVFNSNIYEGRVYNGFGNPEADYELFFGPNIKDWPEQPTLSNDILLKVVSHIEDEVTTTDELIPSGETSSYRSNPLRLAEFTLSRRDPEYVGEAKKVNSINKARIKGEVNEEVEAVIKAIEEKGIRVDLANTEIASAIYAHKPGDGSAREQAASCQRVLGAGANFAREYATKRYRSNCINWGILPFVTNEYQKLEKGTWVYVPSVIKMIDENQQQLAYVVDTKGNISTINISLGALTSEEKEILKAGCLINYYKNNK